MGVSIKQGTQLFFDLELYFFYEFHNQRKEAFDKMFGYF